MKPVIVVGTGGHASALADALLASGRQVLGALRGADSDAGVDPALPIPALGGDDVLRDHPPSMVELACGLGSVRDNRPRMRLLERFQAQAYRFTSVIHPSAVISANASLGEGVQVLAGAIVGPGASLAEGVLVNTGAVVEHGCRLGAHVHVATRATLAGEVAVGELAFIGCGAVVIQRVTIGPRAVIGAGAAVVRDVAPDETVIGVPAGRRRT